MATRSEKILAEAQKLYNEGKWPESNLLIADYFDGLTTVEGIAEANRLRGWNYYYIGTKGPAEDKRHKVSLSRDMFYLALEKTSDAKKKLSILNGLPLSLWVLEAREEAWKVSDQAIKEFPEEPSVWNTRSILCRWAKNFEESVKVCEKVYVTALFRKDYRTAGHGKQNRADALKELGRIAEAKDDYAAAIGLYKNFEKETGQSAAFHIEGVAKKLSALSV